MSLSAYLRKSISTGVANTILSAVSVLVFLPLIIERIGIEKYGVWAMLAIFSGASGIADMGISKSLVYFIPKEKEQRGIDNIFSAGLLVNVAIILLLCFLGSVLVLSGINIWGDSDELAGHTGNVLTLCGATILVLSLATSLYRALLEALLKIHVVNLGFMALTIFYYSSAYIASIFVEDVDTLLIISSTVYGGIFVFHVWYTHKFASISIVWPGIRTVRKVLKYALGSFSISILEMVVQPVSRYLLAVTSTDTRLYGIFDIGLRLSHMANSLLAVGAVPMLAIFSSYSLEKIGKINRILDRYLLLTGGLYIAGIVLFFLIGELLLHMIFRIESAELFLACLTLMIGVCTTGVAEAFARAFLGLGYLRTLFGVRLLLPVTNFMMIWYLSEISPLSRFSIAYSAAFGITAIATIVTFRFLSSRWECANVSTSL